MTTGTGDFEDRLDTRSRHVDAVAGERQAVLRRDRARRKKELLTRRLQRIHAMLDDCSDPDHLTVAGVPQLELAS
ncbi:MAG TPA: hypothetical protein VFU14_08500 [Acidimicrobiales bacterium]|nr:hypothetical protein [Acidimicrobiales bacterium]